MVGQELWKERLQGSEGDDGLQTEEPGVEERLEEVRDDGRYLHRQKPAPVGETKVVGWKLLSSASPKRTSGCTGFGSGCLSFGEFSPVPSSTTSLRPKRPWLVTHIRPSCPATVKNSLKVEPYWPSFRSPDGMQQEFRSLSRPHGQSIVVVPPWHDVQGEGDCGDVWVIPIGYYRALWTRRSSSNVNTGSGSGFTGSGRSQLGQHIS